MPCWKDVINDWLNDGRIDRVYQDSCYAQALDHLPTDLKEYSSLGDDINLARELALRGEAPPGGGGGNGTGPTGGPGPDGGSDREKGFIRELLVTVGPGNADEVPIPLLVLGALATLLMAAGAAGMVARRTQHRRPPVGYEIP